MTGLHTPSIHFHLGAWAVTAACTFTAFIINFFESRGWLPRFIRDFIGPYSVQRLDYVANITGIVGFIGILGSAWFGFIDATGVEKANYLDINLLIQGYNKAMANNILAFKITWTFAGLQMFLFAILIRAFFVTYGKEKTVYDQHLFIQLLYIQATLMGAFLMFIIAGAGGIWVYGSSVLSGIPILEELLPDGSLLLPVFIVNGLLTLIIFIITIINYSRQKVQVQS